MQCTIRMGSPIKSFSYRSFPTYEAYCPDVRLAPREAVARTSAAWPDLGFVERTLSVVLSGLVFVFTPCRLNMGFHLRLVRISYTNLLVTPSTGSYRRAIILSEQ